MTDHIRDWYFVEEQMDSFSIYAKFDKGWRKICWVMPKFKPFFWSKRRWRVIPDWRHDLPDYDIKNAEIVILKALDGLNSLKKEKYRQVFTERLASTYKELLGE